MTTDPVTLGGAVTVADTAMVVGSASGGGDAAATAGESRTAGTEAKGSTATLVGDTVTLQGKTRKDTTNDGAKEIGRIGAVVFSYNDKGDLRIRFMDSANALVYQTPPVMLARMADIMMRPDSSVSARV
ncbi:hypothetical protein FO488_04290 [Geobacter sp. FeAm09]|uniref:hypothetical protein n=1 Tax=Geobacter sp. FeAm09 TaxID=2597769 RepID=UPI0011EE8C47|nr:hypothetical protein [Geobacter sp. FeAm09]QEM67438.1 hypothetical protein FO488_04290 [Geobacter sp. FeAm09]